MSRNRIERFVSGYGSFDVRERNDTYIIVGYYDDLSPSPEREELKQALREMKRDIDWKDEFPVAVETVSDIKTQYGQLKLKVTVE